MLGKYGLLQACLRRGNIHILKHGHEHLPSKGSLSEVAALGWRLCTGERSIWGKITSLRYLPKDACWWIFRPLGGAHPLNNAPFPWHILPPVLLGPSYYYPKK